MPRLVAFGCSYTFGQALPDVHPLPLPPDRVPSKLAWPSILANKLGYDCVNKGIPGSGNFEILLRIFQEKYQPDDVVVIGWSHFTRHDFYKIIDKNYSGKRILDKDPDFKKIILQSKFTDQEYRLNSSVKNWLCISHANLFLTQLKLKNYFYLNTVDWEAEPNPDFIPLSNNLGIFPKDYVIDYGLDGIHSGIKSQELLANLIYNKINNELH